MIKHFALAATLATALTAALTTGAPAQTTAPAAPAAPVAAETAKVPATPDECIKAAFELAQSAEDKKMSNDELDKVEQMLSKMETHCDANQFTEAMAVSKDIKSFISAKQ